MYLRPETSPYVLIAQECLAHFAMIVQLNILAGLRGQCGRDAQVLPGICRKQVVLLSLLPVPHVDCVQWYFCFYRFNLFGYAQLRRYAVGVVGHLYVSRLNQVWCYVLWCQQIVLVMLVYYVGISKPHVQGNLEVIVQVSPQRLVVL